VARPNAPPRLRRFATCIEQIDQLVLRQKHAELMPCVSSMKTSFAIIQASWRYQTGTGPSAEASMAFAETDLTRLQQIARHRRFE